MTAWDEFSAADFDASRADRRALKAAKRAAEIGQPAMFHLPTPERETAPPTVTELAGQEGLFDDLL